ncbi:Gfo/Idh/MocA family protein [Micromonospora rubida]
MTAPVRFALVGTGVMGSLHARVISQSPRARLARVIEPREAVGRDIADRYGASWAPGLSDLSGIDAVVIAAPTEFHRGLAEEVLVADKPLLIEKPVCGSLSETEEIVAIAEKRRLPLLCGLLERFNPAVLTAFALIHRPVHLTVTRHSPYAPRIRTGVAWDLLVHDIDLAIQAFGGQEPTSTRGALGYFHPDSVAGAEDVAEAVLTFGNTALANISASRIGQRKVRTLVISEVDRLIEADLIRKDVTIYRHVSLDAATPDGRGYRQQSIMEVPELVSNREPLAAQLDHFLDILDGRLDADVERQRLLPAHRAVAAVIGDDKGH